MKRERCWTSLRALMKSVIQHKGKKNIMGAYRSRSASALTYRINRLEDKLVLVSRWHNVITTLWHCSVLTSVNWWQICFVQITQNYLCACQSLELYSSQITQSVGIDNQQDALLGRGLVRAYPVQLLHEHIIKLFIKISSQVGV